MPKELWSIWTYFFREDMKGVRVELNLIKLGRKSYAEALGIQKYFARLHLNALSSEENYNAKNVLLIVEHNPVYTIGLRTKDYMTSDENRLKSLGAEFYRTNRGGLITFHGIGQLVAYPIVNLKHFKLGMKSYVRALEEIVIKTCKHFEVEAVTTQDTGIWVKDRKICALGKYKFILLQLDHIIRHFCSVHHNSSLH